MKYCKFSTICSPKHLSFVVAAVLLSDRADRNQFPYFYVRFVLPHFACKIHTKYGNSILVGSPAVLSTCCRLATSVLLDLGGEGKPCLTGSGWWRQALSYWIWVVKASPALLDLGGEGKPCLTGSGWWRQALSHWIWVVKASPVLPGSGWWRLSPWAHVSFGYLSWAAPYVYRG